ncbi:hypothetical protein GGQ85_003412 [Nitrobacter vulgaris]|nr:hypothetical protein [Nitrobacter vulgaris]
MKTNPIQADGKPDNAKKNKLGPIRLKPIVH